MDLQRLTTFVDHYYDDPDPSHAAEALEFFIGSERLHDEAAAEAAWFVFSRIAELAPQAVHDYEDVIARTEWPIKGPGGLDFLWGEFFITGNTQAIVRIIDVLERPDQVREKLQTWLDTTETGFLSDRRRSAVVKRLSQAGILLDSGEKEILTAKDLDCYCILDAKDVVEGGFARLRTLLPFTLSQDDVDYIGVKAAAKWSLGSNAQQHRPVLEACETEAATRIGRSRLSLLEIAAKAQAVGGNGAGEGLPIALTLVLRVSHSGPRSKGPTNRQG